MKNFYHQPWRLVPNYIRGMGGRETAKFRGEENPKDFDGGRESWIGSTVHMAEATPDNPYWGCAEVELPDGSKKFLFEVINESPEEVLGQTHMAKNGTNLGVLVKYLDPVVQFNLQCHPTREVAKKLFNQDHGKAESWYVISTRDDLEEPPYLILGFKEGITREKFEELYREGDQKKIEALCHKIPVHPGDSYFLGGGVPHLLGAGSLVIEVQEPQDITMIWRNYQIANDIQRNGMDEETYDKRLLGSYIYEGLSYEETVKKWQGQNEVIRSGEWGSERIIIGPKQTTYFSFTELTVNGKCDHQKTGFPQVAIVTKGAGKLLWENGSMDVKQGDELFFPYDIPSFQIEGDLSIILCNPEGAMT